MYFYSRQGTRLPQKRERLYEIDWGQYCFFGFRIEKPFHPEIGSGVRGMLFELMTPITAVILARHVEDVVENFEPRARLVGVRADPDLDRNVYDITIEFYVVNVPTELVTLQIMLERVR